MSDPLDVEAHARRADVYLSRNDLPAALGELEAVLRERPGWAAAVLNYGSTLLRMGRDDEAEQALSRAIELDAHLIIAYRLLGSLLHRHGRIAQLARICREGRARNPQSLELESFELFLLNFDDAIDDRSLFARHLAYGERLEASVAAGFDVRRSRAARRLRIGYVSSDLKYHPVGPFHAPCARAPRSLGVRCSLLRHEPGADAFTARLSAASDSFRNVSGLSDDALAQAIYDAASTCWWTSPVIRASAGWAYSAAAGAGAGVVAGLPRHRGLLRIAYAHRPALRSAGMADEMHTEKLVRLPHSQWCYRPFFEVAVEPGRPSRGTAISASAPSRRRPSSLPRRAGCGGACCAVCPKRAWCGWRRAGAR